MTTSTARPRLKCPDCTATAEHVLIHDRTCPASRSVETLCASDETWFLDHPHAGWRWRDIDPSERAELQMAGFDLTDGHGRVLVVNDGMGRHRRLIARNGTLIVAVQDIPPAAGWAV